jgi:hypothetical protein
MIRTRQGRVSAKRAPVFHRDKREAFARIERDGDSNKSHPAPEAAGLMA